MTGQEKQQLSEIGGKANYETALEELERELFDQQASA